MCPYTYYTIMRQIKDSKHLRLRMIHYATQHGIKPAARFFHTSPQTVRKWLRRWDGTIASLEARSRRPHRSPNKLSRYAEKKIIALKKQLPRFSARRLKMEFELPWSIKAIHRVCKDAGLVHKYRRKKHQTKRYLRAVKKQWRFCQQICIDTKDLCDIPEYWTAMNRQKLPRYQYTAREVSTGLQFLGYSNEHSLVYSTLFAERIIRHLKRCGVDLSRTTWQSDNGSEFIGSWHAKNDSRFTQMIERTPGQIHKTIPPGAHTFQADVETVHATIESEFYEVESFPTRSGFIAKAASYNLFYNVARKNSGKEWKTPWELIEAKNPRASPWLPMLEPIFLDELFDHQLHSTQPGGNDVWGLPYTSHLQPIQ